MGNFEAIIFGDQTVASVMSVLFVGFDLNCVGGGFGFHLVGGGFGCHLVGGGICCPRVGGGFGFH